jgi:hypothetical protein
VRRTGESGRCLKVESVGEVRDDMRSEGGKERFVRANGGRGDNIVCFVNQSFEIWRDVLTVALRGETLRLLFTLRFPASASSSSSSTANSFSSLSPLVTLIWMTSGESGGELRGLGGRRGAKCAACGCGVRQRIERD